MFGYSGLVFTLVRNVLLVPLYLQHIDLGEYGAWLATGGALVQLLVTDFGLSGVITQRVAMRAGSADLAAMRALISAGLANAIVLGLALAAASSLVAAWLPATQGLRPEQVTRVLDCYLIAVAANACGVFSMAALAALRGAQRPAAAGSVTMVADVASVIVTLVCLYAGLDLYAIAYGLLARSGIAAVGAVASLASIFRHAKDDWRPRWRESLDMWRDSARFFVTSIAMRLQSQANILFVGSVLGPQVAAVYGLTVRAHETVLIVVAQLNSAFGPVLAHLAGTGNLDRLNSVIRSLLPLVAALAAVGAVSVAVLNHSFVSLWVGSHAYGGATLTILMAVAMWVTSLAYVGYEALLARGEFSFIARIFAIGSVLHVVMLVAALSWLGAWGAPLALVVSSLCWGSLAWGKVAADARPVASLRGALGEVALIGAVACIAAAALLNLLPLATSWAALAAEGVLCAVAVAAVLLVVHPALQRTLRSEIVTTLRALRAA
ncbi:MAG: hypothetical protein WDO72_17240 [Pseudomonadota bacterium]